MANEEGAVEIRVPGDVTVGVRMGRWLVGNGGRVEVGQAMFEWETEQACMEVCSMVAGWVQWVAEEYTELGPGALVGWVHRGS